MVLNPIKKSFRQDLLNSLLQSVGVVALASMLGVVVNLFHPNAIPIVADKEYETMVPCPVSGGEVKKMNPGDLKGLQNVFVVDARSKEEFSQWHYKDAVLLTYDFLDPIPEDVLSDLTASIAHARAQKVVVYGDGGEPDTGKLLGQDISGSGIKNVYFINGGAPVFEDENKHGGTQ